MSNLKQQYSTKTPSRIFIAACVMLAATLIAGTVVYSEHSINRKHAIQSAITSYQLTAKDTRDFITGTEVGARHIAESLAKFPDIKAENISNGKVFTLFSQTMAANPAYYNIFLGFPNGDFYELISLKNNPAMRSLLKAEESDVWVVSYIYGLASSKRIRQLDFLDANLKVRHTKSELSNFDARARPWFHNAKSDTINKTPPYLFRYPQIPGQTYSIKLANSEIVLGIDTPLQVLSTFLASQPASKQGEIYLFKPSGEIIASAGSVNEADKPLPPIPPLKLSAAQREYISSLGSIKISNEQDWPPLDFAVAGEPQGYTVDLLKYAAAKIGLEIEFINGYSWAELSNRFDEGKIDILQPIADSPQTRARGYVSAPIADLPLGLAFREGETLAYSLEEMQGRSIAIPKGWSSIALIRSNYPEINIIEVATPKAALEAVRDGKADATLDAAAILHYMANHYFIEGLSYVEKIDTGKAKIPKEFHLLISDRLRQLGPLLEFAIKKIDRPYKDQLRHKWLSPIDAPKTGILTVPYQALLNAAGKEALLNTVSSFTKEDSDYFAYTQKLDPNDPDSDYLGMIATEDSLSPNDESGLLDTILMAIGFLLLMLPISWIASGRILKRLSIKSYATN